MHFKNDYLTGYFRAFCLMALLLHSVISFSQNVNKKWYFGDHAALDFMTNPPTSLSNCAIAVAPPYFTVEGTASIADVFGDLLFYTDGTTVWNKSHQVMANGTGLFGNYSTTQSALIVKQPGNSNIYFIFTLSAFTTTPGLCYSTVDMNLAAGMGSVTVKNTPIVYPSTEKLIGTRHCNGIDTWVVSHDINSNVFRSQLVTTAGVSTTFTSSSVGSIININTNQVIGYLKISPSGKKMGCSLYSILGASSFELYDFDNSTGLVSNLLTLNTPVHNAYSCEFSPDETKFYGSFDGTDTIMQWNLCAGSNSAIINSCYTFTATLPAAIQLATDDKIYVGNYFKQTLGIINNPNLSGAACNYVDQALSISPNKCSDGLPNIIFEKNFAPFTYTITPSISCNTATFTPPPPPTSTITACNAVGYNITGFAWYFGDPASGPANTSTVNNPSHAYPAQGTYTACLVYYYNNSCGGVNTDTLKQKVLIGVLPINSTTGFDVCPGKSLTLSATGAQTYFWSTGAFTTTISVSPLINTSYTLFATDTNGCAYKSVQLITVKNNPVISILGNTLICPGYQAALTASGASSYTWSTGSTNTVITSFPTTNAIYTVTGYSLGCTSQKTVSITVGRPEIKILGSATLCPGSSVTQTASGVTSYLWSTGETTNTVVLTPTATTIYTILGTDTKGCTNTASVLITLQTRTPLTDFSYHSPACEKSADLTPIIDTGFTTGGFYSSTDLPIDQNTGQINLSSAPSGTYVINYFLDAKNCFAAATSTAILVLVPGPQLSATSATNIAPGASITLTVSGGTSYSWSPSDYLSCITCSNPIASPSRNIVYCINSELNSCRTETCISISVSCDTGNDYSVPNAFSPNGDGTNDAFCLQGWNVCTTEFSVMVYDRWGELVYESQDPDFCWDGFYKGKLLSEGVFVYVIKVKKFNTKDPLTKKGNITLLR